MKSEHFNRKKGILHSPSSRLIGSKELGFLKLNEIKRRYNLSYKDIDKILHLENLSIPLIKSKLSPLEAVVKYLKEEAKLSNHIISLLLKKNDNTIFTAYSRAVKKDRSIKKLDFELPVAIFSEKLTVFEATIKFLKENHKLSCYQISKLLDKNIPSIYTVYARAKKKYTRKFLYSKKIFPVSILNDPLFKELIEKLKILRQRYKLSIKEIISTAEFSSKFLPLSVFATEVAPLEALIRFLKENLGLSYHDISTILNRDQRTIWTTYQNSLAGEFRVKKSDIFIPIEIFADRRLSILESLVRFLKDRLSYHEISELINRDERTTWTVYSRSIKKQNGG